MNLNVISKMEIEYADALYFDESVRFGINSYIVELANKCNKDNIGTIDIDNETNYDEVYNLVISKRIWMRMLDALAQLDPEATCVQCDDINYTAGELYIIFRDIYKNSSKNNSDSIHLEWF